MNTDQIMSLARKGGATIGTLLTIIGIVPADQWLAFANAVYNAIGAVSAVVGPAMLVGTAAWGWYKQSTGAKIAAVNAIDGVKVVAQSAPAAPVTKVP